jgi:hypothetical protein
MRDKISDLTYYLLFAKFMSTYLGDLVVYTDGSFVQELNRLCFHLSVSIVCTWQNSMPYTIYSLADPVISSSLYRLPKCLAEFQLLCTWPSDYHWDSKSGVPSSQGKKVCCILLGTWPHTGLPSNKATDADAKSAALHGPLASNRSLRGDACAFLHPAVVSLWQDKRINTQGTKLRVVKSSMRV